MPAPWRTPADWKLPALMLIRLVPAALTCSSIVACAPRPSATIVMTAPTPMIIPSIVRMVRILLRFSAFNAIRSVMNIDMVFSYDDAAEVFRGTGIADHVLQVRFGRRQRGQLLGRVAPVGDLLIRPESCRHGTARAACRTPRCPSRA